MFDSQALEGLPRDECLALMSKVFVGRFIFTDNALPAVLPVNFALHDSTVIICVAGGSKLAAAARNTIVAFEVDEIAHDLSSGWCVTVIGHACEVTDPAELAELTALPLRTWNAGPANHYIKIEVERVSGRRIHPGCAPNTGQ
jgi:uncharacterized protein